MPYTLVDDVRLYYEDYPGDGPDLLLIHGAAQDTLSWRFNVDHLRQRFRVLAIDLPGHGKSQMAPGGAVANLETYSRFAQGFMNNLDCASYYVMGHSMAGGIALHMALRAPSEVNAAILVDGACYTSGTYGEDTFELVSINPTDWFEVNFRTICSPKTSQDRIEEIAFDVRRCAPEAAMNDIRAYAALDLREQASSIDTPVLALHGEDDWSIPPELGQSTVEMIAGPGQFVPVSGTGHFPHTEAPEAFHEALESALESCRRSEVHLPGLH